MKDNVYSDDIARWKILLSPFFRMLFYLQSAENVQQLRVSRSPVRWEKSFMFGLGEGESASLQLLLFRVRVRCGVFGAKN